MPDAHARNYAVLLSRLATIAEQVPAAFEAALAEVDDWHGQARDLATRLLPALRRNAARYC